ncbi:MAG: helix-turn-helix transcriptional regulator [Thermomicrobiales bacterium]|nr:helix-turn-helix transcriptional regulator [Thermomicrobiales bacterium]
MVTATTAVMSATRAPVGELLRRWRERRRLSQLALAAEADVSARHVSFLETGRARPSREMLLRLAEHLEIPLRERNALLVAAGYAPAYPERRLDDPALQAARQAVDLVLAGHRPYPAHAVDRHWTLVATNDIAWPLLIGIDPGLLEPPINVLRLSLHPRGLAPRIANLRQWRAHILHRLHQQVESSADPVLETLLSELAGYPVLGDEGPEASLRDLYESGVVVPLRLRSDWGLLALFSTVTIFGTPVDVTLSELAIEAFFPADAPTAEILHRIAEDPTVPRKPLR